jgi:thioredoxin 1
MSNETTDKNFEHDVLKASGHVLVDFWAEWCGPCRQLAPIVDDVANELKGKLEVFKVNIDQNPDVPAKYNVRGIPTLVIFKDGAPVSTKVGSLPKSSLVEWIETVIAA